MQDKMQEMMRKRMAARGLESREETETSRILGKKESRIEDVGNEVRGKSDHLDNLLVQCKNEGNENDDSKEELVETSEGTFTKDGYCRDPMLMGLPSDFFEYYNEPLDLRDSKHNAKKRLTKLQLENSSSGELYQNILKTKKIDAIISKRANKKKKVPEFSFPKKNRSDVIDLSRANIVKGLISSGEDKSFLVDREDYLHFLHRDDDMTSRKDRDLLRVEEEMQLRNDENEVKTQMAMLTEFEKVKKQGKELLSVAAMKVNPKKRRREIERDDLDVSDDDDEILSFQRRRKKKRKKRY